jgi:hypothetical protein
MPNYDFRPPDFPTILLGGAVVAVVAAVVVGAAKWLGV